ncbi:hypothetical protein EVAR_98532_1 [Eumeta japonica]|uniref:Uncharacterized protein n=1 Tax=Eumeta variegata TaxID=151549 RepID=A0A4C2A0U2_EUMVA|nr:hypothetical protein EVAR_98532_1 [Eumeta japonica]
MRARRGTRPFHSGMVSPPKERERRDIKVKGVPSTRAQLARLRARDRDANVLQVILEDVDNNVFVFIECAYSDLV